MYTFCEYHNSSIINSTMRAVVAMSMLNMVWERLAVPQVVKQDS